MESRAWNHNIHYHGIVVRAAPPNCRVDGLLAIGSRNIVKRCFRLRSIQPPVRAPRHFRDLLCPGGVLVTIDLYRSQTIADLAFDAAALPASWILRTLLGYPEIHAPIQDPGQALAEIQSKTCARPFPGVTLDIWEQGRLSYLPIF